MANVRIIHTETGGIAEVSQEALDHHLRNSGWMTEAELGEHQARLAEREQQAAKAAKNKPAASESEGDK